MTFCIAGLHSVCRQEKPFNPILGETFQARFDDGTAVYCEQVSHHPPVTAWEFVGPQNSYHFSGRGVWEASFRGNSVKGQQMGECVVSFSDGSCITFGPLPEVWIRNILFGERLFEYYGTIPFHDEKHNLHCEVQLNPDSGMIKWLRGKSKPTDMLRGDIVTLMGSGKTQKKEVISRAEGTWLGGLDFDGKRYWDIRQHGDSQKKEPTPVPDSEVLKSDSRFRTDLIALAKGDLREASEQKHVLEEIQREEARLRKEGRARRGITA
eukprot:TRINITY_DN1109_c0_g1_i2.p1 TRINITY_DN1109_c0_g1~~TRINITY_DN1109_c0_g1_i2.p1  ORF type:complete len:266 (+),score=49.05 TRINITY_DN1109_c0_g1_i2:414-1211(+)